MQWFGPDPAGVVSIADVDLRVGGRYHIQFGVPGQETHDVSGNYLEVEPHRRLVFDWCWKSTPERVSLVSLAFKLSGAGTELVFVHERFFDQAARDGHNQAGPALSSSSTNCWLPRRLPPEVNLSP